jgi:hypothetical protein
MRSPQFPVHRLPDGALDYAFYYAEATRLRQQAHQRFWRGTGHWLAGRLSALTSRPIRLALASVPSKAGR